MCAFGVRGGSGDGGGEAASLMGLAVVPSSRPAESAEMKDGSPGSKEGGGKVAAEIVLALEDTKDRSPDKEWAKDSSTKGNA